MKKILFSCLMMCSLSAFSQSIATVLSTVGKVIAQQGQQQRTISRGSAINTGDIIITAANSRAQIKYTNGTLVSIDASSHYQTLKYAPDSDTAIKSELKQGSISYDSNAKKQKKSLLQTPVVALAILGTRLQAKVGADNTYVKVSKGMVCVDDVGNGRIEQPCLGPDQQISSGLFDKDKKFTPLDSIIPHIAHSTVVDINETIVEVAAINTINSTAQTLQQLTQVADIVITIP